jgi:hypothetical protein
MSDGQRTFITALQVSLDGYVRERRALELVAAAPGAGTPRGPDLPGAMTDVREPHERTPPN